jgi:hypothetical protein
VRFAVTGVIAIDIGGKQMIASVRLAATEGLKLKGDKVAIIETSNKAKDKTSDVILRVDD